MTPANSGRRLPGEVCSPEEIRALMRCCSRGATGARNRALIALLWRCGLRSAEALALRPADVDAAAGLVRVRAGKGGKPRVVGIDDQALAVLDVWVARRSARKLGGDLPLFCALNGRALDGGYVRRLFKRLAMRAGIGHRVHPHGLRHSYAVEMLREQTPLPVLQAALGHSSLSVTSRYLAHVTPEDLAARARSRPRWTQ